MTIAQALQNATKQLRASHSDSPSLDAEVLLAHVLKKSKEFLYSHSEEKLKPAQAKRFNDLNSRRAKGGPVAYLTSHKEFFGLDFLVTNDVLIPRPATEGLVKLVIQHFTHAPASSHPVIYDLGTGSGCIAITLAKHISNARIIATDISRKALNIARKNAQQHAVKHKITFIQSDPRQSEVFSFQTLARRSGHGPRPLRRGSFAETRSESRSLGGTNVSEKRIPSVLIANLPYLTPAQYRANPDLAWEPKTALVGGRDGFFYFHKLAREIKSLPRLPQAVFLEIDPSQKTVLKKLFSPLYRATFKKDLQDLTRYLTLTRY